MMKPHGSPVVGGRADEFDLVFLHWHPQSKYSSQHRSSHLDIFNGDANNFGGFIAFSGLTSGWAIVYSRKPMRKLKTRMGSVTFHQ